MHILLEIANMVISFQTMQLIQDHLHPSTVILPSQVNGCHPTMVKPYFLASGITAVDLPSGPHLVGQHE